MPRSTENQFVNRTLELEQIQAVIDAWDTRKALFIQGDGGVGKTCLLREAYQFLLKRLDTLFEIQPGEQKVERLGVLVGMSNTEWAKLFMDGCLAMAREMNIELLYADGRNDPQVMAIEFEWLVEWGAQAVLIDVGLGERLQQAVDTAIQRGVKVLTVASDLSGDALIELRQDDQGLAYRSLSQLFEGIDGTGEIIACWSNLPSLVFRRKVLESFLHEYPKTQLVAEIGQKLSHASGSDIPDIGLSEQISIELEQALEQHPNVKAIWATTAEFGVTVLRVLKQMERTDVELYSIDFDLRIRDAMLQPSSPWKATAAANPSEVGRSMVRLAVQAAAGEKMQLYYTIPIHTITSRDVQNAAQLENHHGVQVPGWDESSIGLDSETLTNRVKNYRDALYADSQGRTWLLVDFIDLDNLHLQSSRDIELMLVQQLGEANFKRYLESLESLRQLELRQSHSEQVARQRRLVEGHFFNCLANILLGHRTVIFCDTMDAVNLERSKLVTDFLLRVGEYADNVALLFAGRTAKSLMEELGASHGLVDKHILELQPLEYLASTKYLDQKLRSTISRLSPDVREKIIFLSAGLPILIDLAVDWLAYAIPMQWLDSLDIKALRAMQSSKLAKTRHEFKYQLVQRIQDIRSPLDRLVLALARVYPMNAELCATLLGCSSDEAQNQIEAAQQFSFVKLLPDGTIKLHDVMRAMVLEYVWPQMEDQRKARDSRLAVEYFQQELQKIQGRLEEERRSGDFVKQEYLERSFWQLSIQLAEHTLAIDLEKGLELFIKLCDQATNEYRLSQRELLLDKIWPYQGALPLNQQYEVIIRRISHLNDRGQYDKARHLANQLLQISGLEPRQHMDVLTKLGNSDQQSGQLDEAQAEFQLALEICRENPDLKQYLARMMSNVGRVLGMKGHLDQAAHLYEEALRQEPDLRQLASLYNDLGVIWSERGDYERAERYCLQSLNTRRELNDRRLIGSSLNSLGGIYRNRGEYEKALEYYDPALEIFEQEGESIWLARLYAYRGATLRLMRKFDEAIRDLQRSLKQEARAHQAYAYHVLGCVYKDQERYDEASRYFHRSDEQAKRASDARSQINNLVQLAEIDYIRWLASNESDPELPVRILEKADQLEEFIDAGYGFPHHRGRMQLLVANLRFEQGDHDRAMQLYSKAFFGLSMRLAGYGQQTLDDYLNVLEENLLRLAQIDRNSALYWCRSLKTSWSKWLGGETVRRDVLEMKCDICLRKIETLPR